MTHRKEITKIINKYSNSHGPAVQLRAVGTGIRVHQTYLLQMFHEIFLNLK